MRKFRILALMLVLIMVLAGCGTGNSTPAAKDIVILYTNDAHCGIEDGMGYQGLSAAKRALLAAGNKVLLVDNGDAVQGDTIGTLSKGEYIIDIMNKLGYDVATPGNHEFDYGMDQFNKLVEKADFDYISCNFVDKDGNPVLKPYVIKEADGVKIAFVGISTPKTITTWEALQEDLSCVRERGYAIDDEEHDLGVRCIAAPIYNWNGTPVGAMSISGSVARMNSAAIDEFSPKLKSTAGKISELMGWHA